MSPKIVRWSFKNIHIPMIAIDGELVCTNKQIMLGLGTTKDRLWSAYRNHKEEMDSLRYDKNIPKEFLEKHRVELGVERIKADLIFWSEDAMLNFAFFLRTPSAVEFRKEIRSFIKEHRKVYIVGLEEAHSELRQEFESFKEFVTASIPSLDRAASLAGSVLQAQKDSKILRAVLH